ncbi:MAG TPA: trypsin-like peptidase domain-containing protein [Caulobacteraceae bacterium]|nr:trypsin-like peptidase domain-containing protein [Caulobacteraceae bacterium]
MASAKTRFMLCAVLGVAAAMTAPAGAGMLAQVAHADPAPAKVTENTGALAFAPPPGAPLSFADIFDRVSPAVVSINVTAIVDRRVLGLPGLDAQPPRGKAKPKGGDDDQDDQDDPGAGDDPNSTQAKASGSGFFISADGYIVTNNHVIENAKDIKVVLPGKDQRELPAKVIGRDEGTDLAVIKVEGKNFPYVNFENSARPRVGDWVIAVGNPFGLGGTATAGIISAYGRDIGEKFVDYIQIDAPINRGNSGGPTFDVYGRVIGINTAIFSPSGGGSVGIGFAIPAEVADAVTKQLMTGAKITRGYLGATIQDISPEIAESLGKPDMKGAIIDELVPGGPAAKGGVQPGDVVLSVNGVAVRGATDLTRHVAASHTGDILSLSILRGADTVTVEVRSGLRPSEAELAKAQGSLMPDDGSGDSGAADLPAALGITLAPLDSEARRKLSIPADIRGALVMAVDASSDAAGKGLKPGDVVLRVNGRIVLSGAEVAQEVDAARKAGRANVLLFVYHDRHQAAVAVKIASDDDAPANGKGKAKGKAKAK